MSMKYTKRAKSIPVFYREIKVVEEISEYICPTCCIAYVGAGLRKSVLRFKCECGQELIVKSRTKRREP